jgi:hypothetical protein
MNSYEGATIQMQTKKRFTDKMIIGKCVKQCCPLSTSHFNLGIDPNQEHKKEVSRMWI